MRDSAFWWWTYVLGIATGIQAYNLVDIILYVRKSRKSAPTPPAKSPTPPTPPPNTPQ